ncbi:hypothetical protein FDB50_15435 [Clostridium botulinum]|uniref:Uncharacterized protein n=1 Tax=Clostridium botulinum TaxID=1491 RepID=A0A846K4F7_CLOBO|nr:hypothetical protein [Clostridium botulinum]NFN36432.1 hypothetical protein [Clostridium botulinum]
MIKKDILEGKNIKEVTSNFVELENLIKESLTEAKQIKQVFEMPMDNRGMSLHSVNVIDIDTIDVNSYKDYLIININNFKFSLAIDEKCSVSIQMPQVEKLRLFFNDFKMWLFII